MDIIEAAGILGMQLDVDDVRYPTDVRIQHLNAAQQEIAREYETRLTEGSGQFLLEAGVESFSVGSIYTLPQYGIVPDIPRSIFYTTSFSGNENIGYTPTGEWTRMHSYSDYTNLVTAFPEYEEAEEADESSFGYTCLGDLVHVRPARSVDMLLLVVFDAMPAYITSGTSRWLTAVPFAVIYNAAMTACSWLEDEERIPVYRMLYERQIEPFNTMDSQRNDGPREMTEV